MQLTQVNKATELLASTTMTATNCLSPALNLDARLPLLREHGSNSLSCSSLQDGIDFFIKTGCGYIAYTHIQAGQERPLCLADPICSASQKEQLVRSFLIKYPEPIFVQISKDTANILSELGFCINEIGTETIIDLQDFTLSGNKKEFLRSQKNRAVKDGILVKEAPCSSVPKPILEHISANWMIKKVNNQELRFLTRPATYQDEMDVRTFFAYQNNNLVGFSVFDPIYSGGKIIGYLDSIHRSTGNTSYSIQDYLNLEAIHKFKEEGKEIFSLGYSPLYAVNDTGEFKYSKILKLTLQYLYEHANYLYNFKGLVFHKTRYRPGTPGCRNLKVYCAYKPPVPIWCFDKVLKRIGINPTKRITERSIQWIKKMANS